MCLLLLLLLLYAMPMSYTGLFRGLLLVTVVRLCHTQSGVCYVTSSQVSTQSYYVQTSYTYYYDCSNFGWGWSYCARTGYVSTLMYSSVTDYVAQFACCVGYQQVGTMQTCTDVDECASNGGLGPCQQICNNSAGSFQCRCYSGYALSGNFCIDINECSVGGGLGPCDQMCTNTVGSFYCSCHSGYVLSSDGTTCNDVNECALNGGLGPCQHNCTNLIGSFHCSCLPGYRLSSDGKSCNKSSSTPAMPSYATSVFISRSTGSTAIVPTPISSVPKFELVQVRLLDVPDCTIWTVPAAQKSLIQSLQDNVNGYCKCNISVDNAKVICYEVSRLTLRGTVGEMQLPYLTDWITTMANTIDTYGISLKVDRNCPVQIQSEDDPECPTGNSSTQQSVSSVATGVSVGGILVAIIALIVVAIVIIAFIRWKKSSRTLTTTINPLYNEVSESLPPPKEKEENTYEALEENIYDVPKELSEMSGKR